MNFSNNFRKFDEAKRAHDTVTMVTELDEFSMNWRVSPHCSVVNLVRAGRQQPKLHPESAGVRLAS